MTYKKHPLARPRRWRPGRSLLAVGILATLSVGAAMPTPAGAATSTNLLYSTDGGATWSSNATVPAGGTVLVRQWYNNDGTASETAASLRTTVPAGFSLQGGSTRVCLNPSTTNPSSPDATERRCATSAEGSVWSGSALQISPSAGHFGESNGSTSGEAVAGRKRYLNLHQCLWGRPTWIEDRTTAVSDVADGTEWRAGTSVGNTAATSLSCGPGFAYSLSTNGSAVQVLDLLGNRYLNLNQCHYVTPALEDRMTMIVSTISNPDFRGGTNTSNVADAAPSCGPGDTLRDPGPAATGVKALDIASNRYLHLSTCAWWLNGERTMSIIDTVNAPFRANTTASNSASHTLTCGPGPQNYNTSAPFDGLATYDLLDTARGRGYAQYALTAPAAPSPQACAGAFNGTEAFTQSGTYQSAQTSTLTSSGNLTVDFSALSEPCPVDPIPTVDPVVGSALVAAAGAGYLLYRRTRPQLV